MSLAEVLSDAALPIPCFTDDVLSFIRPLARHGGGPPVSAISEDQVKKICDLITASHCRPLPAAISIGIKKWTFDWWEARARQDERDGIESRYTEFLGAISRAREAAKIQGSAALRSLARDLVKDIETTTQTTDPKTGKTEVKHVKKPTLLRAGSAHAAIADLEKNFAEDYGKVETVKHVFMSKSDAEKACENGHLTLDELRAEYLRAYGRELEFIDTNNEPPN